MKKESANNTKSSLENARLRRILKIVQISGIFGFNANVISVNFLVRNQSMQDINIKLISAGLRVMKINVKSASKMLIKRAQNKLQSVRSRRLLNAKNKLGLIKGLETKNVEHNPKVKEKSALTIQKHKPKETWQTVQILNLQHAKMKQRKSLMTKSRDAKKKVRSQQLKPLPRQTMANFHV